MKSDELRVGMGLVPTRPRSINPPEERSRVGTSPTPTRNSSLIFVVLPQRPPQER